MQKQGDSAKPDTPNRCTSWFMDWQEHVSVHAVLCKGIYLWRSTAAPSPRSEPIRFVLPGERTRNFLRCLSLEQTARVGAKDQLCRGHWTRRQASWIVSSEVNPSTRVMWPYLLELFSETDLLDSSNWNNQIMKPIARPLLTNLWTAFCLVTGESGDF